MLASSESLPRELCAKTLRKLTFERRETAIEKKLQVTELSLGEGDCRQLLSLSLELRPPTCVAGNQVLELAAMRGVRHCEIGIL